MARLLVIHEDLYVRVALVYQLVDDGHVVHGARTVGDAVDLLGQQPADVLVVGFDGADEQVVAALHDLRQVTSSAVLAVARRGDEARVLDLLGGAVDGLLPRPWPPALLVARVRALLRHTVPRDGADVCEAPGCETPDASGAAS